MHTKYVILRGDREIGIFDNLPMELDMNKYNYYKDNCIRIEFFNDVTKLENGLLYGFSKLKEIILPNELEKIESNSFSFCKSLKKIYIPDSVKEIGSFAFYLCESLEKIRLPRNLEIIDSLAFANCDSLKEFVIPRSTKEIRLDILSTRKETNIIIPNGIEKIHNNAFFSCENCIITIEDDKMYDFLFNNTRGNIEINKRKVNKKISRQECLSKVAFYINDEEDNIVKIKKRLK